MFVIVGLGNPGREYQETRHNAGFMTLDLLGERYNIEIKRHNFKAVFGEGMIEGKKAVLCKPETYMNNSGWSVMELINWYKCGHDELVLVYDDVDLPAGDIRIRERGSSGSHNGMKSVIYQLGFDDFPRVRVGIGAASGEKGIVAHVLSGPNGEEKELFSKSIQAAADAISMIVAGKTADAQAKYNTKKPKKSEQPEPEPAETD